MKFSLLQPTIILNPINSVDKKFVDSVRSNQLHRSIQHSETRLLLYLPPQIRILSLVSSISYLVVLCYLIDDILIPQLTVAFLLCSMSILGCTYNILFISFFPHFDDISLIDARLIICIHEYLYSCF